MVVLLLSRGFFVGGGCGGGGVGVVISLFEAVDGAVEVIHLGWIITLTYKHFLLIVLVITHRAAIQILLL